MNIKQQFLPIIEFGKVSLKRSLRDKVALFFTFVFPLIFLFVFGGIFGSNSDVSFNVALINKSDSEFSTKFEGIIDESGVLKIDKEATTVDLAKESMNRSELDATIILPETFGDIGRQQVPTGQATVLYNQNNEQAGQTLSSILDAIFKDINAKFVKVETPFTVKAVSTATESQRRFDYTFAGLLGFSIISLGIFGPTNVFPQLKKQGILRRYHTTTLKVWQYFIANVWSQAVIGLMSVALLFFTAVLVFDLNMNGDYFSLIAFITLSIAVLFGIGLAIGGWAKNENQAAPLANLITFPMIFLSGTFFPRFLMPDWLQSASFFLPLTPVIDGSRLIITEGKTIFDLGPQVGLLAAWGIVVYIIAFKVFRWE